PLASRGRRESLSTCGSRRITGRLPRVRPAMVRRSATTSTVVECARSAIACARRIARSSTDLPESSGEAPADEARFDAADEPDFLDLEAVIEIHERELEVSGG